jgi:hypothetical protein
VRCSCNAAEETALRDALARLESIFANVQSGKRLAARAISDAVILEREIILKFTQLDPCDPAAVAGLAGLRSRFAEMNLWIASQPPVQNAISTLARELFAVRPLIQQTAQSRSATEQVPSQCYWHQRLGALEMKASIEDRLRVVEDVAQEVMADLRLILSEKRPVALSLEELRSGWLCDLTTKFRVRPLTSDERMAQVAYD